MHKALENMAGMFVLIIITLSLSLILVGCSMGGPNISQEEPVKPSIITTLNSGQIVATVEYGQLGAWLSANKDVTVVTIASYSDRMGEQNPTTNFIIVYTSTSEKSGK